MAEQQRQTTNDGIVGDLFCENGLPAEPNPERIKEMELLQWKKRFEESEAKVLAQENKNLEIMEAKGVLEGKNTSARNLAQGYLNDFPLTSETEGLLKNFMRVLDPDPGKNTYNCPCHSAQRTLTPGPGTGDAVSSVTAGSSRGARKSGAQNYSNIPFRIKQRQASAGNVVCQKKIRRKERPAVSTFKMTLRSRGKNPKKSSISKTPPKIVKSSTRNVPPQIQKAQAPSNPTSRLQSSTNTRNMERSLSPSGVQKYSNKSSVSKTSSKIREASTGDVPPQIQTARAPSTSSTSGLQTSINTRNMEKSQSPSAAQEYSYKSSVLKTPSEIREASTGDVPPQIQTSHAPSTSSTSGLQSSTNTRNMERSLSPSAAQQYSNKSSVSKTSSKIRETSTGDVPPQIQTAHAPSTSSTSGLQSSTNTRNNMEKSLSPSATPEYSNKSSVSKTPSEIREASTGDVAPEMKNSNASLSPTSGLQSSTNTRNMEKSLSPPPAKPVSCPPMDIIATGTTPQTPTPAQSGTLHLVKSGNEDSSLTPVPIALKPFLKSELKNLNVNDETKVIIDKLWVLLKWDPVALKLAISYINEDFSVSDDADVPLKDIIATYIIKINSDPVRGGRKVPELVDTPSYLTWRVTSKKIRETPVIGEEAIKVLEIISFLAADNISTQFFWDLYNSMENQDNSKTRENIFKLLKRFSAINSGSGDSFSVYPPIQQAIRNDLEKQKKLTEVLGRIQSSAQKMIQENNITSQEMIHVTSIWDHVTKKPNLIKEGGAFPSSICKELIASGEYKEAYDFSCSVLPVLESTLEENHRFTLKIKFWSGVSLEHLSEYSKASEVLTEVYEKQKKFFGEEDEGCLETANQIGSVRCTLEKKDKVLRCRNALEESERILGNDHPETLDLKHNLALALDGLGKHEEAMELYQQILEVEERVRGKEDPETLRTKFNVATVRFSQGEFEEALKMFEEVLEGSVLEVDHPDTLTIKHWIADAYRCLSRNDEAAEWYKEVLEKRQQILGPEHPGTLTTKHNLAAISFSQGKYLDALEIFGEVLEVQERALEFNHPDILTTRDWIAETCKCLGRKQEAFELYQELLEKKKEELGPQHPETLTTKHNMAAVRFSQGKYEEALQLFQEILEVRKRVLVHLGGVEHPDTLSTKKWIADTKKKEWEGTENIKNSGESEAIPESCHSTQAQ